MSSTHDDSAVPRAAHPSENQIDCDCPDAHYVSCDDATPQCLYSDPRTPIGPPCANCPLVDESLLQHASSNRLVLDVLSTYAARLLHAHIPDDESDRAADAIEYVGTVSRDAHRATVDRALDRCAILRRRDELPPMSPRPADILPGGHVAH